MVKCMPGPRYEVGELHVDATRLKNVPKWKHSPHVRLPIAPVGFEVVYRRWTRFLRNIDSGRKPAGCINIRLPAVRTGYMGPWQPPFGRHPTILEVSSVLRANLKKHPTLAGCIQMYSTCYRTKEDDALNIKLEKLYVSNGKKTKGQCCICLEDLKGGRQLIRAKCCKQLLHEFCLLGWLRRRNVCPLCCADFDD